MVGQVVSGHKRAVGYSNALNEWHVESTRETKGLDYIDRSYHMRKSKKDKDDSS